MKKAFLALAAVALLFATSCKKESINPAVDVPEGSFLATIDNGANPQNAPAVKDGMGTMTTIDGSNYVIWENGDEIKINGSIYTTTSTPGNTVVFSGGNATGTTFHAFYPASIAGTDAAGTLPATQTIELDDNNNITVRNLPMYATSTNNQLTFHNICAALKITIPSFLNGATSIEVSSSDKAMNGAFTVTDNAAVMTATTPTDAEKKVTIAKASGTFATGEVVYIAVPAQAYTDFKVEFFNGQTSMWNKTLTSCTFIVNKVYNINVTPMGLCFTAGANNVTVSMNLNIENRPVHNVYLEYCTMPANGTCSDWNTYTIGTAVTLANTGDKVFFRGGDGTTGRPVNDRFYEDGNIYYFASSGNVEVSGNIMYLLNGTNPPTSFGTAEDVFDALFRDMSSLTSAQNLILPAQTLVNFCYKEMFQNCSALTTAPALPATTLAYGCYSQMFENCSALTAAPALNAQSLGQSCYSCMFRNCTTLTTAPALPATTLAESCYEEMFNGCNSLATVPILDAETLARSCCYCMFQNCTTLTTVPVLKATTLATSCYKCMFWGCTNLESVTMLATTIPQSATGCLQNWLNNAGTSTPVLKVNNQITSTSHAAYSTISTNTPAKWKIETENGTNVLRTVQP